MNVGGPDAPRSPRVGGPSLTVVMPVLNGSNLLPRSLGALEASDLDRGAWDVVVVDDGSTDDSAALARSRGHRVVRVPGGPLGPGAARNLGAAEATGDILVFIDADVCVHPDALGRIRASFADHPDVGAVFGAYDDQPADPGVRSSVIFPGTAVRVPRVPERTAGGRINHRASTTSHRPEPRRGGTR